MITINKALVAVAGALVQLQLALADSSLAGSRVAGHEWVGIALATLAALGVYAVPYASGKIRPS